MNDFGFRLDDYELTTSQFSVSAVLFLHKLSMNGVAIDKETFGRRTFEAVNNVNSCHKKKKNNNKIPQQIDWKKGVETFCPDFKH